MKRDPLLQRSYGWKIEVYFRTLKSGCKVEALQLGTRERLERALALYLVIAWRILHLATLGRECPELPCEVAFSAEEWRAAWVVAKRQPPPDAPPPLGEMVRIVRRLRRFFRPQGRRPPRPQGALGGAAQAHGLRRGATGRTGRVWHGVIVGNGVRFWWLDVQQFLF